MVTSTADLRGDPASTDPPSMLSIMLRRTAS
jgi:hypothetical protein